MNGSSKVLLPSFMTLIWVNLGFFYLHSKYVVQILVQSHFDLVSLSLALEATEPVSELVTEMALELINNHLISVQQKK